MSIYKTSIFNFIILLIVVNSPFLNAKNINFLKDECLSGNALACSQVGYSYHLKAIFDNAYYKKEFYYHSKACSLDKRECTGLASLYMLGYGIEKDTKKAISLFENSCKEGASEGCFSAGLEYKKGRYIGRDYQKSIIYFKKLCDLTGQCLLLGEMYRDGLGVKQDINQALIFFQKSCKNKEKFACNTLGDIYSDGIYVKKDSKQAKKYYIKECPAEEGKECYK